MKQARILRTGSPLTLANIREACPAVFGLEAHPKTSDRYLHVPTIVPLEKMLQNGWGVYEVSQHRALQPKNAEYKKHMLRLRKLEDFSPNQVDREGVPEVVLINSHDASSSYRLCGGYFRFICFNGMMVGNKMAQFIIRHTTSTSQEVLEAGERIVTEQFPVMLEQIERWKTINVSADIQETLAAKALALRYGTQLAPFPASDLLQIRRDADREPSLWNVLNRIQENVLQGGWEVRSMGWGRRSAVRPIERVSAVAHINSNLWDYAMEIADAI